METIGYLIALTPPLSDKEGVGTIKNGVLVDTSVSCQRCGQVSLKTGLVRSHSQPTQ